jgi:hypothetical protein
MFKPYDIQFVKRHKIDAARWDKCIDASANGLIYGYSRFLDRVSKNWDALIVNDYDFILPLTWNRKAWITYLYQPPLTQQLGIFSALQITEQLIDQLLKEMKLHFPFAEIFLNYKNYHPNLQPRNNFVLNLNFSYDTIRAGFKIDLEKNLKQAAKLDLTYGVYEDINRALSFHEILYGRLTPHIRKSDYARFKNACLDLKESREIELRAVTDTKKEILSVALVFRRKNRLYLVQSTTFDRGRKMHANHYLLDRIINEFSEQNLILDFVGSDIPGIIHFYTNFGALNEPYYYYRFNNLHPWFKIFKPDEPK